MPYRNNFRLFFKIKSTNNFIRSVVNVAYRVHGKQDLGNPIIILHGLLGSKRNWESMSKKIVHLTNKTVIAVDARNHGDSPHHPSHTYPELASDLKNLMDSLRIKKVDIIGHSMGGRTAMVLALNEPARVSKLVVVDISPVSTAGALNDFIPNVLNTMKSISFDGIKDMNKAKAYAKKLLQSKSLNADTIGFILMNIGVTPYKTVGWSSNVEVLSKHFMDIATFPNMSGKTFPGLTLFLGGGNSNYIPSADLNGIKAFFPKAELKYIEGAGHNVHADNPAEFLQIVTRFLLLN